MKNNITLEFNDKYDLVDKELIQQLQKVLNKNFNFKTKKIVDINFINDKEMKQLNKKYRKINKTTDVLSFASDNNFPHDELLGSIFISEKEWKKKKRLEEYKKITNIRINNQSCIICMLVIHGFLHLIGYDHTNKLQGDKMFKLQDSLLEKIWLN